MGRQRQRATAALRRGLNDGILRVPHQAIVEFIAAATRPRGPDGPLLSFTDAVREAEDLMTQFPVPANRCRPIPPCILS